MNAPDLAKLFHDTYERLAPDFGYVTRLETRDFDSESSNGRLMIAVCQEILNRESLRTMMEQDAEAGA